MKLKFFTTFLTIGLIAFAVYSANKTSQFKPAEDFPRGALVYVQIADLPALIKLWNESNFKEKYAESQSFDEFKNRHLGLKLASRWEEFNAASGFPIDLDAVGGLADQRAAVALYDIGKLEFVFIAPVSDEVFAATKFAQNQGNFEEQTLDDGTTVYRVKVEADRGRQKQELIFANAQNRFIMATSEKLVAQTLSNIAGKQSAKNRLADEPSFAALGEKIEPRAATVWINQTALNEDYYFNRYWLMADAENLKNIRAGMFDFSIEEGKIVERRKFLLNKASDSAPIESGRAAEMLSFLPAEAPFYRLQKADQKDIDAAIQRTIFDRRKTVEESGGRHLFYSSSFADFEDSSGGDYDSLNENFDRNVDDTEDETETIERRETATDFSKFFQSAGARAILTFTEPQILPAPLFVEFRRAAIVDLAAPADFNRAAFEAEAAGKFSEQTTIAASGVKLSWETKSENGLTWRELRLPALGSGASYALLGNRLILTNDGEFLRKILDNRNSQKIENFDASFTELTVLNLSQSGKAFTSIFDELAENNLADDFFAGNVASLIDSVAEIKKIEIKSRRSGDLLEEEIVGFR